MKKEVRKKELIKVAYELFTTKGYENTSVDEIIAKAGIAKGTYYYHFESKEQILEEVSNMMIDETIIRATKVLEMDLKPEEKILNIILSMKLKNEEVEVENAIHTPENIILHKKINDRIIEGAIPLLANAVKEGIESGVFNCDNIEERIRMILIMSQELFNHSAFDKNCVLVFIDTVEKMLGTKTGSLSFITKLIKE